MRKKLGITLAAVMLSMVLSSAAVGAQEAQLDSVYRNGRQALNDRNYQTAAELFREVRGRDPSHARVPDTYYWEAFALSRMGEYERAMRLLETQGERFPQARTIDDANALMGQICAELAERGDVECAQDVVRRSRQAQDDRIRMVALNALVNMRADRALPILREVLQDTSRSPELRSQALFIVADKADPEDALEILIDVSRNDPDMNVRRTATFWLAEVDSDAAVDALVAIVDTEGEPELAERALFALAQHDSPRARDALRALVTDETRSINLRATAIVWLAQSGDAADIELLRRVYPQFTDRELKRRIIMAIGQSDYGDAWLVEIALDDTEPIETRKHAIFWAAEGGALSIADLVRLYDENSDVDLKRQMIYAFAQDESSEAVDKLIDIARNETNTQLREQAVFWLGESEDPRATDYLLELIRQ